MTGNLRLEAVARFVSYDLENDKELLEIVELASAVTNCPYALITFLDDDTQYLKVRKNFIQTSVPRHLSFCAHALAGSGLMIVADTLKDPHFVNSPLLIDGPVVRFVASMPLITKNELKVGTLCVFDTIPHDIDDHQQLVLNILGNQVMKILELREGIEMMEKKQRELEEQKELNNDANIRLRSFFESSTNFQILLGKNGEVIDFNKTAFNFVKAVHKCTLNRGDQFIKYLHPEFVAIFIDKYNLTLDGKKSAVEGSTNYEDLGIIWWEAAFEAARDHNDQIIGVSYLIRNVTERKLKEQKIISQNQSLLKIAHIQAHEFRAPLTTIMGLMSLIKADDYNAPSEYIQFLEQAVDALDTTIRHIVSDIDSTVIHDYAGELNA